MMDILWLLFLLKDGRYNTLLDSSRQFPDVIAADLHSLSQWKQH